MDNTPDFIWFIFAYWFIGLVSLLLPPFKSQILRQDLSIALLEWSGQISKAKRIAYSFTVVMTASLIWPLLVANHWLLVANYWLRNK